MRRALYNVQQIFRIKHQVCEARQWQALSTRLIETNQRLHEQIQFAEKNIGLAVSSSELLRLINSSAQHVKLELRSLQPAQMAALNESAEFIIRAGGSYHQHAEFMNLLERSSHIVWIKSFKLVQDKKRHDRIDTELVIGYVASDTDE